MVDLVKQQQNKNQRRIHRIRTRARYGQRELARISRAATLGGLFLSFLKIGMTGFGGGLAVIAQIRTLTVRKRRWLTEIEFAEAFALAQSLPGTNAGNAVTYIGLKLRGWRGASVSMAGFILPSIVMMIALAILYKHLRNIPNTDQLFHGLNAAVVALILVTAWRMGKSILLKRWQIALALLACLAVVFFGATVIEVVLAAGLIGIGINSFAEERIRKFWRIQTMTGKRREMVRTRLQAQRRARLAKTSSHDFFGGYLTRALADERVRNSLEQQQDDITDNPTATPQSEKSEGKKILSVGFLFAMPLVAKIGLLLTLSIVFLKIGAITFGGGFVMIPLIESEVVHNYQWLNHQEFADATALGQITPGPVLVTATFIGYRVAGTLGALVATVSIFLPAFLMTIIAGSSLRRFRTNREVQSFLMGVTPAVVGLLVAAAVSIARAGIHTWIGLTILGLAIFVLVKFRPNPFWVIMGAGSLRLLASFVFK